MTQPRPILLMTRPAAASEAFVQALDGGAGRAHDVVISPLIGVEPRGTLPDMDRYGGVIFTSANGVAAYRALGGPSDRPCYVVGAATAAAARQAGFDPLSADGDAEALVRMVRDLDPRGPLLHLRGTHARGDVAQSLSRVGAETHEAVIYDQPVLGLSRPAMDALCGRDPVVVPLFSPRSAARFADLHRGDAPLLILGMSRAVLEEVVDLPARRTMMSAEPTGDAMRKAVLQLLDLARTLEGGQDAQ